MGFAFGGVIVLGGVLSILAFSWGPMNYTVLLSSASAMLLPVFAGVLFWQETLTADQVIAMGLMLVSFILCLRTGEKSGRPSLKWLLCVLGYAFLGGMTGVLQKWYQKMEGGDQIGVCLSIAMLLGTVVPLGIWALGRKEGGGDDRKRLSKKSVWMLLLSGICYAGIHQMNFYLAGVLPAALLFPVNSGCFLMLSLVSSRVFFRERMRPIQFAGVVIGLISVLLLSGVGALFR